MLLIEKDTILHNKIIDNNSPTNNENTKTEPVPEL